jgi:hypothetical protein
MGPKKWLFKNGVCIDRTALWNGPLERTQSAPNLIDEITNSLRKSHHTFSPSSLYSTVKWGCVLLQLKYHAMKRIFSDICIQLASTGADLTSLIQALLCSIQRMLGRCRWRSNKTWHADSITPCDGCGSRRVCLLRVLGWSLLDVHWCVTLLCLKWANTYLYFKFLYQEYHVCHITSEEV